MPELSCTHSGPWFFDDDETCHALPCGQQHWRCTACLRPIRPGCLSEPLVSDRLADEIEHNAMERENDDRRFRL